MQRKKSKLSKTYRKQTNKHKNEPKKGSTEGDMWYMVNACARDRAPCWRRRQRMGLRWSCESAGVPAPGAGTLAALGSEHGPGVSAEHC